MKKYFAEGVSSITKSQSLQKFSAITFLKILPLRSLCLCGELLHRIISYINNILNLFLIPATKLKDIQININKLLILIIINCIHIDNIEEFPCMGRFQTCPCAGIINKKTLHTVSI